MHADEIQIARFKIEAEAVAALRHPNILQIYDIGESDGSPYVALELLEGGSLADRLRKARCCRRGRRPSGWSRWSWPWTRPTRPASCIATSSRPTSCSRADGIPKITDFGLAKRLEVDEGQTHTGQVMGTPSYMAPEQARGDTKIGRPAGRHLRPGRDPLRDAHRPASLQGRSRRWIPSSRSSRSSPVSPSRVQYRVPRDLETICLKCLQKEPRKRYATAKELADDLNRYLVGEPIQARRTPPIERGIKWTQTAPDRRHRCWPSRPSGSSRPARLRRLVLEPPAGPGTNRRAARGPVAGRDGRRPPPRPGGHLEERPGIRAKVILTSAEDDPRAPKKSRELASLYDRTKQMLGEVEKALEAERARQAEQQAKDEVQDRYRHFLDRRKEALFRDTQFTGAHAAPTNLDLTRKAAEEALGVFAERRQHEDDWTLGDLPAALSSEQQTEVKEGCYELLLVLADAVATQDPGRSTVPCGSSRAPTELRPDHSRAYHLRKASLPGAEGRSGRRGSGARRGPARPPRDRLRSLPDRATTSTSAIGYADAIQDFEIALRKKPDHFWAKCLLAICYHPDDPVRSGEVVLERLPPDRPRLRLALSAPRLRQRPARRQVSRAWSRASPGREAALKAAAEFEFEEAEADFQRGPRATAAHARR